ncbi:hypothetical protein ABVF61_28950 [Roseibium sp. HPY-6]|uniref:hypothetical protein n=1 Tax=Roseibium sp. HPY-6 TaxID=3229852 RepID=UPI00338F63DF
MNLFPSTWPQIDRRTRTGVAPWLLLLAGFAALKGLLNPLYTSFDRTIEGLETKTIYARQSGGTVCVGDMVTFRGTGQRRNHIRRVNAAAGESFSLTPRGYAISGSTISADENWLDAAKEKFGDTASIIVPEDHYLIINSEFGRNMRGNDWAFDVVPREKIRNRVTYILVSRDLSSIGTRLAQDAFGC